MKKATFLLCLLLTLSAVPFARAADAESQTVRETTTSRTAFAIQASV